MFASSEDRSRDYCYFEGGRTGFQPVCLQKTGWKPVLLISQSILRSGVSSCDLQPRPPNLAK